jgi:hypothetical protein
MTGELFHTSKTGIWTTFRDNDVATVTGFDDFQALLIEFFRHTSIGFNRRALIGRGAAGIVCFFSAGQE